MKSGSHPYRVSRELLRSSGRRLQRLLFALPALFCVYFLAADDNGLYQIWHRERTLRTMQAEIDSLQAVNRQLAEDASLLKTDRRTIERLARERYGMIGKNERVYMVYPSRPDAGAAAPGTGR